MHSEIFRVSPIFDQIWITRAMHSEIIQISTNFDRIWITRSLVSEISPRIQKYFEFRPISTKFGLRKRCIQKYFEF
jgi:hypothetical protein